MKIFIFIIQFTLILILLLSFPPIESIGYGVTLKWDTNSEIDMAGYKVYYGTSSGNYEFVVDVGNVTEYELFDLNEGSTYYIATTAYDTSDNESKKSNEACINFISTQNIYIDNDCDGIPDTSDSCPETPNSPNLGTCVKTSVNIVRGYRVRDPKSFITCTSDADCEATGGTCQLKQGDCNENGCGDVCECYADYNDDLKVTGADLLILKNEYGRFDCSEGNPCYADSNEDGKVTGADLFILENEYGRFDCSACP